MKVNFGFWDGFFSAFNIFPCSDEINIPSINKSDCENIRGDCIKILKISDEEMPASESLKGTMGEYNS